MRKKIIEDDLQAHQNINRKWAQDGCDGFLLTKTDLSWNLDYISNPTKLIQNFFNDFWKDIEHGINQHLSTTKHAHQALIGDFFFCIQGNNKITKFSSFHIESSGSL